MGNKLLGCKLRDDLQESLETKKKEKYLEDQIYLPGSLDFLERVGLDRCGRITDKDSTLLRQKNIQSVFDDYCEQYLDLDNSEKYIKDDNVIGFGYFLRLYKTAFFWKKIRFEQKRVAMLSERRGYLAEKDHQAYERHCDSMRDYEERCL